MQEKQFLRFNNNRNNEIIFYTRNGQLFRPMCVKTPHIDVVDQTNNCYKDIPVRFANNSKRGFLLNNDIITDSSRIVECSDIHQLVVARNEKQGISRNCNINKVVSISSSAINKLNVFQMHVNKKFEHSALIKEGIDIQPSLNTHEEEVGNFYTDKHNLVRSESGVTGIATYIDDASSTIKSWFISIGLFIKSIVIFGFILSCISLIMLCKVHGCKLPRMPNRLTRQNYERTTEGP